MIAAELEHLQRFRGGYDPAPAAARVLPHRPAALLLELPGSVGVVEGPDRLRRVGEGGVVPSHDHSGQQDGHAPAGDRLELRGDERADLGLCLGDGDVEGEGRRLGARKLLAQELVADLRAVAMCDHDGPVRQDRAGGLERGCEVGPLLGRGPALAGTEQRVAPERDDGQHGARRSR